MRISLFLHLEECDRKAAVANQKLEMLICSHLFPNKSHGAVCSLPDRQSRAAVGFVLQGPNPKPRPVTTMPPALYSTSI